MEELIRSGISCRTEPCLRQKTKELGISFDDFIGCLKDNKSNLEISSELGVTEAAIDHLQEHFQKHGLSSSYGE